MDSPQQGRDKSQRQGRRTPSVAHRGRKERPPEDTKQQQGANKVNGQVRRMVAPDLASADGVVDCQREIHQRPAGDGLAAGRRAEWLPNRPELPDRGVIGDRDFVVEDKGAREAIAEGRHSGQHDQPRRQDDRPSSRYSPGPGCKSGRMLAVHGHVVPRRGGRGIRRQLGLVATFHRLKNSIVPCTVVTNVLCPSRPG